jgi:hypothetical protein
MRVTIAKNGRACSSDGHHKIEPMRHRALLVAAVLLGCAACGPAFTPPVGPGVPAPDAADTWTQATTYCRGAKTYSAMLNLGAAGANVQTTVTSDGRVFIGAIVAGRPRFTLAGTRDAATLVLHDDRRVVRAPAAAIVEAVLGTAIEPAAWMAVLTGCLTPSHDPRDLARVEGYLRVTTSEGQVYLQRQAGVWRVRGGETLGLIVDYEWRESRFPTRVRARSEPGGTVETKLTLETGQLSVNDTVPDALFGPPPGAATAAPMTLEELRDAGLLSRRSR